jgi:serine/threonine protein kinase
VKQRVGSYEIVRILARGGMAVVYLAHQPALDRDVALKQLDLQGTEPTRAQRFVREARLAAALDHPNIVTLFDFFEDGGVPYIAMEYVGGGSLRPLVGELDLPQVFGVLEGVLAGLAHAEAAGIAHRDLKPENVLITRGGGIKIADFGIARAYNALTPSLTSTGSAIGTPTYMAPEQALDEPIGPHTDIYALGVVAYELLAGRPPFEPGRTPMAILYCHVHKPPPPLAGLAPDVPEAVRGWVEWMLAKRPEDRPGSAAEASQALEEIAVAELGPYWRRSATIAAPEEHDEDRTTLIDIPSQPTSVSLGPSPTPRRRRRRLITLAMVPLLALATTAAAILAADSDPPARSSTPEAQTAAPKPKPEAAVAYDFDGDGSQEIALGMPGSGKAHAGVVVVRDGQRAEAAGDALLTPAVARLKRLTGDEGFGTSIASADFNGDGRADLAVSAPGRDLVAVIHGTGEGLRGGRVKRIGASEIRANDGPGQFGSRLLATDMNRDGFGDLVVGAPNADKDAGGSGSVQILFGSRGGIRTSTTQLIPRPVDAWAGFGTKLRTGDVNGDKRVDLIEGAPDGAVPGHASVCTNRKKRRRVKCRPLVGPVSSGTSGLAVADVNGDGIDDVIQGDAVAEPAALLQGAAVGGEVRVYLGRRGALPRLTKVLDQRRGYVPGYDEVGDQFGAGVDAGDLDGDDYADVVVAAPGEDEAGSDDVALLDVGSVSVLRGARHGMAVSSNARFFPTHGIGRDLTAHDETGWSVAVLDVTGDKRPDLAISIRGADRIEDSIYLIEGRKGAFAPIETKAWRPLRGGVDVSDPRISRIRIGRADGA